MSAKEITTIANFKVADLDRKEGREKIGYAAWNSGSGRIAVTEAAQARLALEGWKEFSFLRMHVSNEVEGTGHLQTLIDLATERGKPVTSRYTFPNLAFPGETVDAYRERHTRLREEANTAFTKLELPADALGSRRYEKEFLQMMQSLYNITGEHLQTEIPKAFRKEAIQSFYILRVEGGTFFDSVLLKAYDLCASEKKPVVFNFSDELYTVKAADLLEYPDKNQFLSAVHEAREARSNARRFELGNESQRLITALDILDMQDRQAVVSWMRECIKADVWYQAEDLERVIQKLDQIGIPHEQTTISEYNEEELTGLSLDQRYYATVAACDGFFRNMGSFPVWAEKYLLAYLRADASAIND